MQFETQISCLVMGKVTENLPSSGFDPVHLNIPENIQLADPLFNQKSEIDLLLGSDIFWNLLCIGQIKLGKNKPTLQKTKFGWIISGPIPNYSNIHNNTFLSNINIHEKIHNEISKFWEIEDCQNHKPALSEEETLCENHFIATTKRHESGKLIVSIPFKSNVSELGESYSSSLKRFYALERKLDQKHLIVIPGSHHVTKLIIEQEHKRLMHAGTGATLSAIRCKYWPVSGRNSVRQVLRRCISCYRTNPKAMTPVMGNLPACRLQPCRPFIKSGVDYAGPFIIKEGVYKRKRLLKAYIALFVCMTTKAVHIELVSDLTTDAFLATLKRFIARRGIVTDLFSDNGTNFVGANNELHNLEQLFKNQINGEKVVNTLANDQISWHFIPPRAPHFAGLWEASVKSLKNHLKRVIGDAHLTFEAFSTVLTQIEAILNSRPLTPMSNDPNDLSCLTAGHFLIGDSMTSFPHPNVQEVPSNRLTQWQRIEQLRQHFWTRWSKEYISLLQQRSKWKSPQANVELGQLVLIKEDNLPPLRWVTGRIVQLFPGQDKITRVVLIKTSSGLIKRSVSRVCVLPIDTSA
jgi:hypothetical protein